VIPQDRHPVQTGWGINPVGDINAHLRFPIGPRLGPRLHIHLHRRKRSNPIEGRNILTYILWIVEAILLNPKEGFQILVGEAPRGGRKSTSKHPLPGIGGGILGGGRGWRLCEGFSGEKKQKEEDQSASHRSLNSVPKAAKGIERPTCSVVA
jgi:hypothetical protein